MVKLLALPSPRSRRRGDSRRFAGLNGRALPVNDYERSVLHAPINGGFAARINIEQGIARSTYASEITSTISPFGGRA
jgi:hypothetical protein